MGRIRVNRNVFPDWMLRLTSKVDPISASDFDLLIEGLAQPIDLLGEKVYWLEKNLNAQGITLPPNDDKQYVLKNGDWEEITIEGGGVTSYNDLQDVPLTFPPAPHTHNYALDTHNHDGDYEQLDANIVRLENGKLPMVDGSQLTNLPSSGGVGFEIKKRFASIQEMNDSFSGYSNNDLLINGFNDNQAYPLDGSLVMVEVTGMVVGQSYTLFMTLDDWFSSSEYFSFYGYRPHEGESSGVYRQMFGASAQKGDTNTYVFTATHTSGIFLFPSTCGDPDAFMSNTPNGGTGTPSSLIGYAPTDTIEGDFVLIETGNPSDIDNNKLYKRGATQFDFYIDFDARPVDAGGGAEVVELYTNTYGFTPITTTTMGIQEEDLTTYKMLYISIANLNNKQTKTGVFSWNGANPHVFQGGFIPDNAGNPVFVTVTVSSTQVAVNNSGWYIYGITGIK